MKVFRYLGPTTILDDANTESVGTAVNVKPFRNVVFAISAATNSSLTLKFQGSVGIADGDDSSPDFSAGRSKSNHWDYIETYDHENTATALDGDTGLVLNNATEENNVRLIKANVDNLTWVNIEVADVTDGTVSAFVTGWGY